VTRGGVRERLDAMTQPATVRIARRRGKRNTSRSGRAWSVLLDGRNVGSIVNELTLDLSVEPGHHTLRLQSTRYLLSPEQPFDAYEGQTLGYVCEPRSLSPIIFTRWLVWLLISLVNHNLWISLQPDDSLSVDPTFVTTGSTTSTLRDQRVGDALSPGANVLVHGTRAAPVAHVGATGSTTEFALVVKDLTKRFGERTAFSEVSFNVGYGEVFGFLGPNGAGKTTTVRTLGTLIAPTSGSALVAGIPLSPENGVEIRQRIAIMPESPGLYLRMSVAENLKYFAGLYGLQHPEKRITDALAAVNLVDRASDLCGGLSKGLRQRVGLARTLLSDPAVMFLDEPTAGLDPVASLEVHNLIIGLRQKGVTIFLTTHRLDEAEKLCDRVAIMNTKLRTVGRPADLRDQLFSRSLVVRTQDSLRDPKELFSRIPAIDDWRVDDSGAYVLSVSDPKVAAPLVARALVGEDADILFIGESQHSLEDVYLELIADDVELHRS
jgi:ABC-2 type transport system ATP-binding protein